MRADLTVAHKALMGPDVVQRLAAVFPPHNPTALDRSPYFGTRPEWRNIVLYCSDTPLYRIVCIANSTVELQVTIETIDGDMRQACQAGWSGARQALGLSGVRRLFRGSRPRLASAKVIDPDTGRVVLEGHAGFGTRFTGRQALTNLILAAVGVVLIVLGLIAGGSSQLAIVGAGAPGVLIGMLTIVFGWLDWRRGVLQWA
jgi:hypothetical protein